jgi:hypothetical protein
MSGRKSRALTTGASVGIADEIPCSFLFLLIRKQLAFGVNIARPKAV